MKKAIVSTLIMLLVIFSVCVLPLKGEDDPYAEDKAVLNDMIFISQAHITDVKSVKSAKEYADTIDKYASALEELKPRMMVLEQKYPNIKKNDVPAPLNPLVKKMGETLGSIMEISLKMSIYAEDPDVKQATQRLQAVMKGGSPKSVPSAPIMDTPSIKTVELITTGNSAILEKLELLVRMFFPKTFGDSYQLADEHTGNSETAFRLVVAANDLGSKTLEYYGKTSTQNAVSITMKLVQTKNAVIKAGPVAMDVKFTQSNKDEILRNAVGDLCQKLIQH